MKRIGKLTGEQEAQIPKYIAKYIALASEPMNKDIATTAVRALYKHMGEEAPIVIFGSSPLNAVLLCAMFQLLLSGSKPSRLDSHLSSRLDSQLYSQLRSQLDSQLYSRLDSQLYSQLHSQLDSQLDGISKDGYLTIWWLAWAAWYNYAKFIGVEFDEDVYSTFMAFTANVHFIIPYSGIAFIAEKPINVCWHDGQLHNAHGPAVEYSDGYSLWSLNGVTVDERIVTTPAAKLDPRLILSEKNAEVRRELVRKIGIERMYYELGGKVLDKRDDYELITLNLGDGNIRPYLKMINPSIGVYHIEGVPPDVRTVDQALTSRKPTKMRGIPVSFDGEVWYQQGDVCIWPRSAKALQPSPIILT